MLQSENTPSPSGGVEYRRDIDGMRMIAVVVVILFHYGLLTFGYLGVDVFFVISGFLITGIIHREAVAGDFRFEGSTCAASEEFCL